MSINCDSQQVNNDITQSDVQTILWHQIFTICRYMAVTVEKSEQGLLLGSRWVEKHRDLVEKYGQQYHELTWQPLIKPLERVLSEVGSILNP